MTAPAAVRHGATFRLAGACAGLMLASIVLGSAAQALRPAATRLPWVGDWERHIESLAFKAGIPVTFLAGARTRVDDAATMVFDARVPEQYEAGHLPRALSLPVADVAHRIGTYVSQLTPETPILVYCGGADCDDALELALRLREYGFTDLTLYPGGFAEWTTYGGAIRTGDKP